MLLCSWQRATYYTGTMVGCYFAIVLLGRVLLSRKLIVIRIVNITANSNKINLNTIFQQHLMV